MFDFYYSEKILYLEGCANQTDCPSYAQCKRMKFSIPSGLTRQTSNYADLCHCVGPHKGDEANNCLNTKQAGKH